MDVKWCDHVNSIDDVVVMLARWAASSDDMVTFGRRIEIVHMLQHEVDHG